MLKLIAIRVLYYLLRLMGLVPKYRFAEVNGKLLKFRVVKVKGKEFHVLVKHSFADFEHKNVGRGNGKRSMGTKANTEKPRL